MVQKRGIAEREERAHCAGLGIVAAVNQARDPRVNQGASAHGARLERDGRDAIGQTPIAQFAGRLAEGENFRVGGGIGIDLPTIVPAADDAIRGRVIDDAAHRHFVHRQGFLGLGDRLTHQLFVAHGSNLRDRSNLSDFGHLLAHVAFDAVLKGHSAAGTAVAGPVETDLDDARVGDIDQLDIPPIGLNGRADQIDHALDLLAQRRRLSGIYSGRGHGVLNYRRRDRPQQPEREAVGSNV